MHLTDHPCGLEVASFVFHKIQLFLQCSSGRERFSCTYSGWNGSINFSRFSSKDQRVCWAHLLGLRNLLMGAQSADFRVSEDCQDPATTPRDDASVRLPGVLHTNVSSKCNCGF